MARRASGITNLIQTAQHGLRAIIRRRWLRYACYGSAGVFMYLAQCSALHLNLNGGDAFMGGHDITAHYIGWQFYRAEPWGLPLGRIQSYMHPFGTTITQTDSIPWVAAIAKLFSRWLPQKFQYFGWWTLFCFIMQGVMAGRLFDARFRSFLATMAAVTLLLLSPPMMYRLFFHSALVAHWLLLWAVYLFLEALDGRSHWREWVLNLSLSIVTHPYLFAMNFMMGFWCTVHAVCDHRAHPLNRWSLVHAALPCLCSLAAGFVFGVFSSIGKAPAIGLGVWSANLNAFFNPMDWSVFLKGLDYLKGQYAGFAYPGLGVLLAGFMALILVAARWRAHEFQAAGRKLIFLALVVLSLMAFAVGPKVAFGSRELFSYELPHGLMEMWSIFRATGRFVWPVCYLLVFISLLQYWRGLDVLSRGRQSRNVLAMWLLVLIQVADLSWAARIRRWQHSLPRQYTPTLVDSAWERLGDRYKHLIALPLDYSRYDELALIAVRNGMTLNYGYVSHEHPDYVAKAEEDIRKLCQGVPDAQTAYVIKTEDLLARIQTANPQLNATCADGFWLVAP